MKTKLTVLVALITTFYFSGFTQSTNWMKSLPASGEGCTQDIFQNVYATGKLTGTQIIDGNSYTSAGNNDLIITKTDANGNVLWIQQYGSSGNEVARAIAKGSGNHLWVAGIFSGTFNAGPYTLTSTGSNDVFLLKLDPLTGDVTTAISGGGTGAEDVYGIEIIANGDVFVAGNYSTQMTLDGITLSTPGSWTPFMYRLDANGNALWGAAISNSAAWSMTADNNGNSYISGFSTSASIDVNGTTVQMNGNNHFTTKLDPNGNHVWSALSDFNGEVVSIDVDNSGNVYFAGNYDTQATFGTINLTGNGSDEVLIGKVDASGSFDWVYSIGAGGTDNALQTSVDHNGNIYFSGGVSGTINFLGTNVSGKFIAKFDTAGAMEWVTGSSGATVVWKDLDAVGDRVIATAYINGLLNFGNDTVTSNAADVVFDINGVANRITGTVFIDNNLNGQFDSGESGVPNSIVQTTPFAVASSNLQGTYNIFVNSGSYTTSMPNPPLYHNFTTASSYNVSFTGTGNVEDSVDFGLDPIPNMNDLRVTITSITAPKAGFVLGYHIKYKNVGTTDQSATLTLTADNTLTYLMSYPSETSSSGNVYTYDLGLLPAQNQGDIYVYFNIPGNATVGSILNTTVGIDPNANDEVPSDNFDAQANTIVAAYDPNYKSVDMDTLIDISGPSYLEYEIHFQNLGTAPATNVLLIDTIDINYLDIETIEIVSASHGPVSLQLENNRVVKFLFENINLPDSLSDPLGSVGYVKFRMQQNGTLPVGSSIENFADIYFDFNEAVRTNTATTVHAVLGINELNSTTPLFVYPNPASTEIHLMFEEQSQIGHVQLFDMSGRMVKNFGNAMNNGIETLDVSDVNKGTYLLQVEFGNQLLQSVVVIQ